LKASLLNILRCPSCRDSLTLDIEKECEGEIEKGNLTCTKCQSVYPILRCIPRFVATDKYLRSFSAQWTMFAKTQLDKSGKMDVSSGHTFKETTGFDLSDLKNRWVLEAGCGMGRFLDFVSREDSARVVGVDLSFAVEPAFENVGRRRNVDIVQADIMHPPFSEKAFDIVYSVGVLHHTPNPMHALCSLTPLVQSGGEIAVWVYPKYNWTMFSDLYRRITWRLPWSMLLGVVKVMVTLHRLGPYLPSSLRKRLDLLVPISGQPNYEARVLDTYDWYSPRYQFKSTEQQVISWFTEAGLTKVELLNAPVAIRAKVK